MSSPRSLKNVHSVRTFGEADLGVETLELPIDQSWPRRGHAEPLEHPGHPLPVVPVFTELVLQLPILIAELGDADQLALLQAIQELGKGLPRGLRGWCLVLERHGHRLLGPRPERRRARESPGTRLCWADFRVGYRPENSDGLRDQRGFASLLMKAPF